MIFTFLHSTVQYIPSTNTVNDQGMEYNHPTSMDHTCSSLISYFRWKNNMKTFSDTVPWDDHIKAPLTKFSLNLHGLQIWPHLPAVHQRLILMITLNTHILFYQTRIPYALTLLYLSLQTFNLYLCLQPRIQPLKLVMKICIELCITPLHP